MRKTRLLILLFLYLVSYSFLEAQTPISGVINTYHKVTAIDYTKACAVVNNAAGLNPGDKVLLVQMKGARIALSNNTSFGDVLDSRNAGNYELGTVCRVNGDSVFLLHSILKQYTIAGKVQLVRVPVYDNAMVTDSLKAAPWNNSTGTGGVLALSVTYSLFLNAPVSATGMGFKGGKAETSSNSCGNLFAPSDQYYDASFLGPQLGAYKGEGIWDTTVMDYSGGKGPLANGGGGGNNHNNGGGGGANLRAGGKGGGNNSSAGCYVSNPAEGGNALNSSGGAKIYPGGGGGAGHINSGGTIDGGGNGGGIIYIKAQSLMSGGRTISANGLKGGDARGDGASGGGAGGTILMDVDLYTDGVSIQAYGGAGGKEDDLYTDQRCYGEGGGGSGGVVYFKGSAPAGVVNVSGGAKGLKVNSDVVAPVCNAPIPGAAGVAGLTVTGYTPVQSTTVANSCTFMLPTRLLYFKASVTNRDVYTRWQVVQPEEVKTFVVERKKDTEGWKEVARVAALEGADTYTAADKGLSEGSYTYRLKILGKDGSVVYPPIQRISITSASQLTVFPNPAKGVLQVVLPAGEDKELKIYDLNGRLLIQKRITERSNPVTSLDVTSLPEGLYILRIGKLYKVFRIQ